MVDEREISPIDDRQLVTQEVEGLGQTLSLFQAINGGASVRLGHKTLRTLLKRSSLWELPGVYLVLMPQFPSL